MRSSKNNQGLVDVRLGSKVFERLELIKSELDAIRGFDRDLSEETLLVALDGFAMVLRMYRQAQPLPSTDVFEDSKKAIVIDDTNLLYPIMPPEDV